MKAPLATSAPNGAAGTRSARDGETPVPPGEPRVSTVVKMVDPGESKSLPLSVRKKQLSRFVVLSHPK